MGLFGAAPPIDREELEWLLACFAWFDRTLGERDRAVGCSPSLVFPDDPDLIGAGTASELFLAVKHKAGLEEWECRLEQGEKRRAPIDTGIAASWSQSSALGTFSIEGNTPVIHYDPALLRTPDALVATLAHELAHLVMHSLGMPPGGEALEEHATDCMAIYLGFGIFLANNARNFTQFSDGAVHGWSSDVSGYLSENAIVTGLAIFEKCFGTGAGVSGALKDYLRPVHRKAVRYLDRHHPDLRADLGAIDLAHWT